MNKVSYQKKLFRCISEPTHDNYAYIVDDNNDNNPWRKSFFEQNKDKKMNLFRQISSKAKQKIDQPEKQAQDVGEILQKPMFTKITWLEEDNRQNNAIIQSFNSAHTTIIETGLTTHRQIKKGKQRFRWNLLFNLLLFIVVPLPFWIPFVSNSLAIYLLPSIQTFFVFIWIGESSCIHNFQY